MKAFVQILLTVAATVAGNGWTAAVADDGDAAYKKELEKFAGTWQLVVSEKDGVKEPEVDVKQIRIIFKGDKFTLERAGKTVEEGWICIDPTRRPRVIDVYATEPESKVVMGVYEWDSDDKFMICGAHPGTEQTRPTLFSTGKGIKGTGHTLHVCKREDAN
jgi:uncharacterized protein (TIGR03067 family)